MKVCSEEIFGPVICVEKIENIELGILRINDTRFGLQAGIFTDSIKEMDKAFQELEVGGVILNDVPTLRFDHMPYGGIKDSGLGREGVRYAMHDMLEPKILVK
jgi:acyl-CoA reductase-like NAD-dependent aldehyde dehydrogenase